MKQAIKINKPLVLFQCHKYNLFSDTKHKQYARMHARTHARTHEQVKLRLTEKPATMV